MWKWEEIELVPSYIRCVALAIEALERGGKGPGSRVKTSLGPSPLHQGTRPGGNGWAGGSFFPAGNPGRTLYHGCGAESGGLAVNPAEGEAEEGGRPKETK